MEAGDTKQEPRVAKQTWDFSDPKPNEEIYLYCTSIYKKKLSPLLHQMILNKIMEDLRYE